MFTESQTMTRNMSFFKKHWFPDKIHQIKKRFKTLMSSSEIRFGSSLPSASAITSSFFEKITVSAFLLRSYIKIISIC